MAISFIFLGKILFQSKFTLHISIQKKNNGHKIIQFECNFKRIQIFKQKSLITSSQPQYFWNCPIS